jgi:hypothetical protein
LATSPGPRRLSRLLGLDAGAAAALKLAALRGESAGDAQGRLWTALKAAAGASLAERYFANRTDGLRPSSGEDLLVATI